ncbi:glycerophosphodiester phosphodiesterase [Salinarchaeum laminariae]|uniref:glycerophosphodiester phosphodiesterase n=1 Tax=Salinarchaeum laminariae TaxID=869888 RepID=UPI0020BF0705|nr:glycerophosphodiester phosphodiesterase [Salinarchaeum laminariae]
MALIAHRGFAAERAENTIPALERAAGIADAVEFDVRRCGSGEPVVVHDETVDRVTDSAGPVSAFTADELAAMDVLESGAGIPTLAAVAAALPADTPLYVELKESGLATEVLDAFDDHEGRVTIIAFDRDVLRAVRAADPTVPRAVLAGSLRDCPVATALELGCAGVNVRPRLLALPSVRRAAQALDLHVGVWTVNDRATARLVELLGADAITSDHSDFVATNR